MTHTPSPAAGPTRAELTNRLRQQVGSWPSVSDLSRHLGRDRKAVRSFMAGVPVYAIGKCHCYMVEDVAKRLLDSVR